MRVLFLHQNFPGQFKHLAPALAARGDEVRALAVTPRAQPAGVKVDSYAVTRANAKGLHPWALDFETKTIRAEACGRALLALAHTGYVPDIVVGHPAWGETWLVKDVWPQTRLLAFQEFFYGADTHFDPEFAAPDFEGSARARVKNASVLMGLETMDWGLSPMAWQRAQFPVHHQRRISVVFDGIDSALLVPDANAFVTLPSLGLRLTSADEVITFVNRNLEPARGYHVFMRALPELQRLRPRLRVFIVGGDEAGYGARAPEGSTWREQFLREVQGSLDMSRVHFVGRVPLGTLHALFRIARCHVYLTYPFVLSWSMLEAMSLGCLVVGSRTPPVEEVLRDGDNGVLVDFFDPRALAQRVADVLANDPDYDPLRQRGRATVAERYDLHRVCLPRQFELIDAVASGANPNP